ncbi:O-antigen ligase C-terminal domain-containing protein [Ideonella sp. B7]|nr:O-antigen ligase C-terminal domain-containing protein [Ideonella benzenivorans]
MQQPTSLSRNPLWVAALLALTAPALLAFNVSPSTTLLNQLLAVGGWGAVLMCLPRAPLRHALPAVALPLLVLGVLLAEVLWSWHSGLPSSLALSSLAQMLCAGAVLLAAQAPAAKDGEDDTGGPLVQPVLAGLVLAGVLSSVIALLQVFAPQWTDGTWIAHSGLPGRAVGNLRQPNHLSTLILWGVIALVPLAQAGRVLRWPLHRGLAAALGVLMIAAVVLTASRTGMVATVLLAGWGALDRRLSGRVRLALLAVPVVYGLCWLGMAGWAHESAHVFGGEARLAEKDLSSSRFAIWKNTLSLIAAQPWTGVGWGEFNFAWTLSPFPDRPVAFFDHTHNLLLQFAVELGVPVALLLAALLGGTLVQAFRRSRAQPVAAAPGAHAALVMVLLAGLHSLLEYPLWYAYFLLPTAWALGHALRRPPVAAAESTRLPTSPRPWALRVMGGLMTAGALFAVWDYHRVVVIYQPGDTTTSLAERIRDGQRSVFFSYQADYALATTTEPPSQALGAFETATHALLDTRLMMAWAQALDESGHPDEARALAERLREFRNPASDDFFAVCDDPEQQPRPFQCEAPARAVPWQAFMPAAH